jgi:hypothetical protein
MRIGGGKKHGHYYMGGSLLDTASTTTLAAVKAALAEMEQLKVISDLRQVTEFLHMFTLRCNIGMNNCRRP